MPGGPPNVAPPNDPRFEKCDFQSLGSPRSSFVNFALRTVTDAAFRAAMSGEPAVRCWSLYSHVMPGTQEEAAERVDVTPWAAINRRTRDIGQPFGGKTSRRIRKMLSIS